nr:pilin [Frateuria defendens]
MNTAMADSAPHRTAVEQFGASHQRWPDSLTQLGMAPFAGDASVAGITLGGDGALLVSFANPALRGHLFKLTPYVRNGAIHWSCGGDVPEKLLPPACRATE